MRDGITLYFVRHGETDWNAELRYQGQRDIALNANGRAQALSEAERATAVSEGQEHYRRFSTRSSYQSSAVTMFRGN